MKKIVENDKGFVRDMDTNAILRIDNNEVINYKKRREKSLSIQQQINNLNKELETIKNILESLLQDRNK